jgi:hypothetical protein
MPEVFIINRFKYKDNMTAEWWDRFKNLKEEKIKNLKKIVELNIFDESVFTGDIDVDDVLRFYLLKKR